ncbi:MAG TPA: hypothetical protein VM913_07595 [Sphingomicrobium sp.]|nr:hypothetical protein [Sphingomicrobium sp.]
MHKFLVAAAVATTALTAAVPAAAQYYPAPANPYQQPYYGQGYGNGHGQHNYGLVRSYQVRVDRLQRAIARMDSRDRISEREARSLRQEARFVEQRVRAFASNGRLNNRERRDLDIRLARLEQRLIHERRDRNGRADGNYGQGYYGQGYNPYGQGGYGRGYNGYNGYGSPYDRDRDGRDDRYEDDRGRYPG